MLTTEGCTVETRSSGEDALKRFTTGDFNLLMTDQAMPGLSGDKLAEFVRQISPDIPIIMVTGFGDMMSEDDERLRFVDVVISKPFTKESVMTAISQVTRNS